MTVAKALKWADIFDNLRLLEGLSVPLIVLHGTEDNVVPIVNGETLVRKYDGSCKVFIRVEGANHNNVLVKGHEKLVDTYKVLL